MMQPTVAVFAMDGTIASRARRARRQALAGR